MGKLRRVVVERVRTERMEASPRDQGQLRQVTRGRIPNQSHQATAAAGTGLLRRASREAELSVETAELGNAERATSPRSQPPAAASHDWAAVSGDASL